ncbi:AsmA family protein [Hymenobacter seoulensis]
MTPAPLASTPVSASPTAQKHWGRWLLLGLGVLVVAVVVGLTFFLDPWLRSTLEKQVAKRSQGRYHLRIGELRTSLWQQTIRLRHIQIRTVGTTPDSARMPRLRLAVGRLEVGSVGLLALLRGKQVPIDSVVLDSVALRLLGLPAEGSKVPLHQQLPLEGLRIKQVQARHVWVSYGASAQPLVQLGESALQVRDLWLSAEGSADSSRISYAAGLAAQLQGAVLRMPGHKVTLGKASFSSDSGRLRLAAVAVHPEQGITATRTRAARISLALPQVVLTGLDAAQLARQHFRADTLRLSRPRLALTLPSQKPPSLHELLASYLTECRLKQLVVEKGQLRVTGLELAPSVADIDVSASDMRVLPHQRQPSSMYYAQRWLVRTGRASATLDAPYYHLSWQKLTADTRAGQLRLTNTLVVPTMPVEALARSKGHQSAHVSVKIPDLLLTGFDYPAAANQQQLRVQSLTLRRPSVSTRSDGRFPINPNPSIATPEKLGQLPFRFGVEKLRVEGATITMLYRAPRDPKLGVMSLNRMGITLRNITNNPQRMSAARPLTGEATGWVQNAGFARVALRANLLDAAGRHTFSGAFGTTSLTILNSMTVNTRGLAFRSGDIRSIRFQMALDRRSATGTMWSEYSNLKLQLLNDQERPGVLHRIGTSAVNGIFIRDNNPRKPGQPLETGKISSSRELRYSVFSLWRQGLVSGLLNSAGVPAGLAKKLSESE